MMGTKRSDGLVFMEHETKVNDEHVTSVLRHYASNLNTLEVYI